MVVILYSDGNLWGMGNNELKQLGDWTTNSTPRNAGTTGSPNYVRWVQPRIADGGAVLNDIKWISPNEHDMNFPAINVIKGSSGDIYNWGTNAGSMIGRTNSGQGANTLTAFDPGQPYFDGSVTADNILAVETGGHTSMLIKKCQKKFGYVGHFTNGSATGDDESFYPKFAFTTAEVEICGAESGTVQLSLNPDGAAVTIGVPVQLTYSPTGGNFSVTGNATITQTGVLTPTGSGSITVTYSNPSVPCAPTTIDLDIPASRVKIDANDDFNAGIVYKNIPGNVSQNDGGVNNPKYGTNPSLKNSPPGSHPSITLNENGTYVFNTDKPGIYTYDVTVCPNGGSTNCLTTKLIITVTNPTLSNSASNPPHADLDLGTTKVNTPITLDIKQNDGPGNIGKNLGTPTITADPKNGTATIDANGKLVYTPNPGFTGKDTITYQVCDTPTPPNGNCATALAIITVVPEEAGTGTGGSTQAVNTTSAADDYAWTPVNTPVIGNVKTNDVDIENNSTTVTTPGTTTIDGKGTLVLNSDGSYTFTPALNFTGTVDFPYTICDDGDPQACDNASLHIVVYNTQSLAVNFGNLSAKWVNGQLVVEWATLSEKNNALFEVEISKDGVEFTKIGEVVSKAKDGNSAEVISYDFAKSANDMGIAGLAILGLAIGAGLLRRRKLMISLVLLSSVVLIGYSCNKNKESVKLDKENTYVRIAQVNKDGSKTYSKVVRVNNE